MIAKLYPQKTAILLILVSTIIYLWKLSNIAESALYLSFLNTEYKKIWMQAKYKNQFRICLIKNLSQSKFSQFYQIRGTKLVLLMYEHHKAPSMDFTLKIMISLKESDLFEYYKEIVHNNTNSLELWGYYIQYCVESQRILEVLESLTFYKVRCSIGSNIISLYNKLAADQIRFTVFQNE